MSLWGQVFAAVYDRAMAGAERSCLRAHRAELLAGAHGEVLEIGGGTGANLPFYGAGVESLTVSEPEAPMARRLQRRLRERGSEAAVVRAGAEALPFADASFDCVVATLVLCTVSDQPRALAELRRVLRPGGRLLFIEHVRAESRRLARWQDRFNPLQNRLGHGCNCNRATVAAISAAGFSIERLQRGELAKAPPVLRPLVVGTAARG